MTRVTTVRRPAAFRLDDPQVVLTPEDSSAIPVGGSRTTIRVAAVMESATEVPESTTRRRRRFPWGTLFWSAFGGIVLLGLGLSTTQLIEELYARAEWLGYAAMALAAGATVALFVIITREVVGLAQLAAVHRLRDLASLAIATDDRRSAETVVRRLLHLTRSKPQLARSRANLAGHLGEIIDGADLVQLAERELMAPLDQEARRLVAAAAKRVSVVTAVSPRAAVDMVFVFVTALMLVRRLAELYGGRPGGLGLVRLIREVVAHLAVTGGMAAGDGLIQQMMGHGIAAKLSARLGEGVLNGLLTARLGLAAIEVARPLPFTALGRPALADLAGDLLRRRSDDGASELPSQLSGEPI